MLYGLSYNCRRYVLTLFYDNPTINDKGCCVPPEHRCDAHLCLEAIESIGIWTTKSLMHDCMASARPTANSQPQNVAVLGRFQNTAWYQRHCVLTTCLELLLDNEATLKWKSKSKKFVTLTIMPYYPPYDTFMKVAFVFFVVWLARRPGMLYQKM